VRLCAKEGWEVSVIMTRAATRFVSDLTFRTLSRRPVAIDQFDAPEEWQPEHIGLADRASVFVVAPCTANVIAKMALGLADDVLSATALATRAPIVVAPAMNVHMWEHPATRQNIATLRARGVTVMEAAEGDLACGYEGRGRMPEPADIVTALRALRQVKTTPKGVV
jgi:phosphopantothenoylcysteine decarboxylase/phosphopantothenate--cysteine ligase